MSPNFWHLVPLVSVFYTHACPQEGTRDCISLPSLPQFLRRVGMSWQSLPGSVFPWSIWSNTEKKLLELLHLPVPGRHSHETMPSNSRASLNLDSTQHWHGSTLVLPGLFSSAALLACFCYLLSPCCPRISWRPIRITQIHCQSW